MELDEKIQGKRKALVIAAERVAEKMFEGDVKLKKSQLNHLVSICGEARCTEEIENYVRYQAGRNVTGWSVELADKVIDAPGTAIKDLADDLSRVAAWRLYAIFLTRAFTYQDEKRRSKERRR